MELVKTVNMLAFVIAFLAPFFGVVDVWSTILLIGGTIVALATYSQSVDLLSLVSILVAVIFLGSVGGVSYLVRVGQLMGWYILPIAIVHGWKSLLS